MTFIIVAFLYRSSPTTAIMSSNNTPGPLANLEVKIEQSPTSSSPPKLIASITNNNQKTVSILDYSSPLDSLIVALGIVELTPHGAKEPVQLDKIAVNRLWPPKLDFLVEIAPGETATKEIEFKERAVPMDKLGKKFTAQLKGQWMAVWEKPKSDIDEKELDSVIDVEGIYRGDFTSNKAEFNLD